MRPEICFSLSDTVVYADRLFDHPKAVDPRTLTFAPLKFSIPKSDQITLKNGMRVYLLEDHELPIVNMTALIAAGSIYDPPEMTSLAGLTGALVRSGGTESLKPDALDAELEFMASAIESGIGEDMGSLSMNTLTKIWIAPLNFMLTC